MRTKEIAIPSLDTFVIVHHEDDWSGDATIEWHDGREFHRHTLPVAIIKAIAQRATKSKTTRSHHERIRSKPR